MEWLKRLKDRFQAILAEYGPIALVVHFSLFFLVLGGFWFAIRLGFEPTGATAGAGALGAAYVMAQVTKPVRLIAVVALTPLLAPWIRRRRLQAADEPTPTPTEG